MSDKRNAISPEYYLALATACKLDIGRHIYRLCKTGCYPALEAIERHCKAIIEVSPERVAARDKMAAVDTD